MQDKQPLFTRLTKLVRSKNVIRIVLWNSHMLFIILRLTRISETSFNICFGEAPKFYSANYSTYPCNEGVRTRTFTSCIDKNAVSFFASLSKLRKSRNVVTRESLCVYLHISTVRRCVINQRVRGCVARLASMPRDTTYVPRVCFARSCTQCIERKYEARTTSITHTHT